jgi:hypothetical protein
MNMELIAMLGGSVTGYIMKLINAQMQVQAGALDAMIKKQTKADDSADRASARIGAGGIWVRRTIAVSILFAVILAPFILSFTDVPVTVQKDGLGGLFKFLGLSKSGWVEVQGFILLPEVRQGMLAILGFYFGSSQVK